MDFKGWIESLPGNPLVTQAAERAGIDRSTISRQLKRGQVSAENVIALARAHDANAVDALVETGYLNADELDLAGIPHALGYATNAQILEEIRNRTDPEAVRLLRGGDADVITPRFGGRTELPHGAAASRRTVETGDRGPADVGEENQDPGDQW